jgi:hypothetical protein
MDPYQRPVSLLERYPKLRTPFFLVLLGCCAIDCRDRIRRGDTLGLLHPAGGLFLLFVARR